MIINTEVLAKVMQLFIQATDLVNTAAEKIEKINNQISSSSNVDDGSSLPQVIEESIEFLKLSHIREISKAFRPLNATEVVAYYTTKRDSDVLILTFARDRVLLPSDSNKLVVIKAEGTSREVLNLFKNNKVIILK